MTILYRFAAVLPVPALQRRAAEAPLVLRARAGDPAAFALLIRRHRPRMLRWMNALLDDRHEAEDAVQLICLAAYRGIGRFRGDCLFSSWLFRIGTRIAVDTVNQRRGRRALEAAAACAAVPADSLAAEPEVLLAGRQSGARVLAVLARMPAPMRQALLLRGIEGHSYAQIAQLQQCAIGTVRSRIHQGRQLVAARLADASLSRP